MLRDKRNWNLSSAFFFLPFFYLAIYLFMYVYELRFHLSLSSCLSPHLFLHVIRFGFIFIWVYIYQCWCYDLCRPRSFDIEWKRIRLVGMYALINEYSHCRPKNLHSTIFHLNKYFDEDEQWRLKHNTCCYRRLTIFFVCGVGASILLADYLKILIVPA